MLGKKEENKEPKPPVHKIKGYIDATDSLSNKSLGRAEWYLAHKLSLRKWLVIFMVTLNSILILFSLYGWGRYFLYDYGNIDRALLNMSAQVTHYGHLKPRPLQLRNIQVFNSGRQTYDLMVDVVNPNASWRGEVTYMFTYAGGVTEEINETIFPGDGQVLPAFGVESPGFPTNVQAQIKNIVWERIDPHVIRDPLSFMDTRLQVSVDNISFDSANQREGVVSHSIGFDITNDSVYGYWVPLFDAVLLNNQTPVGVVRFEVEGFRPGDTKRIELKSLAPTLRVTDIKVLPRIDVFDQTEYIAPGE